ncbi:hypothetical protein D3C72_1382150 [compost metagenome]
MQLLGQQRVGDADQHGAVGIRTRSDPLRVDEFGAVVVYRINADHSGAFLLQRLKARLAVVVRDVPAVFQRDHRVTAPQHHQLAVFNHVRPGGLLFVNLHGADHV